MKRPLALIVDDEPDIRELLEITLARMDIDTVSVEDLAQAEQELKQRSYDLCLTDMRLPDGNGVELVRFIQRRYPALPVAMITAHGSMESAIEALKAGAFDFVSKPVDLQILRNLVSTALRLCDGLQPQRRLLGDSPAMRRTRATVQKLARSQAPVYISGESGTGKELVARLIHEQGPRAEGNFVPVNCGAIPAELMESELFGHKKGSFTGAVADKSGLFQTADRGTLFLDEVGELPLPMQVKLLRAIQEKSVRPVGAQQEVAVDVRILSATHQDLGALVSEGRFRQDLFYRINVIELRVPPLRERPEDIPLLTEHILVRLASDTGSSLPQVTPEALAALQRYDYPGNVRELENILERALTLSEGQTVELDALVFPTPLPEAAPDSPGGAPPAESATSEQPASSPAGLDTWLGSVERARIVNALESTRWNKTAAARLLGISFGALRYRMQKLGLD